MSNGREFQRTDAATGNKRRPTVERRKDGTRSDCDDDNRSRRRPAGLQRESADSGTVERDRESRDTPCLPCTYYIFEFLVTFIGTSYCAEKCLANVYNVRITCKTGLLKF